MVSPSPLKGWIGEWLVHACLAQPCGMKKEQAEAVINKTTTPPRTIHIQGRMMMVARNKMRPWSWFSTRSCPPPWLLSIIFLKTRATFSSTPVTRRLRSYQNRGDGGSRQMDNLVRVLFSFIIVLRRLCFIKINCPACYKACSTSLWFHFQPIWRHRILWRECTRTIHWLWSIELKIAIFFLWGCIVCCSMTLTGWDSFWLHSPSGQNFTTSYLDQDLLVNHFIKW